MDPLLPATLPARLRGSGFLAQLGPAALAEVAPLLEWVQRRRGELVFRQGDPADGVYVVVSGRLRVVAETAEAAPRIVGEVGAGEVLGEMAFLSGQPRTATVAAARDSLLARLPAAAFERLVARHPELVRDLVRVIVGRVQRAAAPRPAAGARTVAVVGLDAVLDLRPLAARLAAALAACGRTTHLHAASVDAALGAPDASRAADGGPRHATLLAWLGEREDGHDFVVYEGGAAADPWTLRCLRQADQVVAFVDGTAAPRRHPLDDVLAGLDSLAGGGPRRVYAFVHPAATALPRGTADWLAGREVDEHHHLRLDRDGDFRRLARFLTGRAVGLALGGGGARGFAHIGVLQACEEAGLAVDLIGGTSMGGLIAAQYALGCSPARICETQREVWLTLRPQKRLALPLFAFLRSEGLQRGGELMFGDARIEDLWLPFFCVSSNLTTARSEVHRSGPLLRYALASASMPAVAQPVVDGNHLLVDGAMLDNVPGEVPRQLGCARVMVSEVSVAREDAFACERAPTALEALAGRIFPGRRRVRFPSLLEVVLRAATLASAGREGEALARADLAFRPPIDGFGLLEFDALDALRDVGYRHAVEQIAGWRAAGRLAPFTA